MEYAITADEEFLRVQFSGRDIDRPPSEICAIILEESRKSGRPRILIELDQKFPLSPTSQRALVTINLVAFNRGVNVRNFPSVEDAHVWLREETAA